MSEKYSSMTEFEWVDKVVARAREALPAWSALKLEKRIEFLKGYQEMLKDRKREMAISISVVTGKPQWEAFSEVDAMINKVGISIEAQAKFRTEEAKALGDS